MEKLVVKIPQAVILTPNVVINYNCGTTSQTQYGTNYSTGTHRYLDDFFSGTQDVSAQCGSSSIPIDKTVTLDYEENSGKVTVKLKLEDGNDGTYDNEITILDNIPHTDYLEKFDASNGETSLITKYNGHGDTSNDMTYLQDIQYDSNDPYTSDYVLYDSDKFLDYIFKIKKSK